MTKKVRDVLAELGVRASKERGQNFAIDAEVIDGIVDFGAPRQGDKIVEIGPGLGALTGELARFQNLTLIEIESRFCADLQAKYPQAAIINQDVREVDFSTIGDDLVVFGNLPYSFSTEIIFHLIQYSKNIKRAVLLLQKEFAERLAASPGSRTYGTISVNLQLSADLRLGPEFDGRSFHPPTKVNSRVIELRMLPTPRVPVDDRLWFQRVVHAAFHERRKMLLNSLTASGLFRGLDLAAVLDQVGIDSKRRAETLTLEEFSRLTAALPNQLRA